MLGLKNAIVEKRCLIVCGGGGVGKTTIAASIAIAATHYRKRVLVVTIDPAKRLAEAFGYSLKELEENGEPLLLSEKYKAQLQIPNDSSLSVGLLNPKYVLDQILEQVLTEENRVRLKRTALFSQLSEMIYGLQEYTAYEWVTRMIQKNEYDLIVLDTPPAIHAKDFFNVPERIRNLMESRVFQLFSPGAKSWFTTLLSFGWLEKLLGEKVYRESRIFFETFNALRARILERCDWLARFFSQQEVAVVTVTTPELSAMMELEGLSQFLKTKAIPLETIIVNQVATKPAELALAEVEAFKNEWGSALIEKLLHVRSIQTKKAEKAYQAVEHCRAQYVPSQVISVPLSEESSGFSILTQAAKALLSP